MIIIDSIHNVRNHPDYKNLIIVRSLKQPVDNAIQEQRLAPSWGLFRDYLDLAKHNNWNANTFNSMYLPRFLREMKDSDSSRHFLNALYKLSFNNNIALYCFCSDESLCHRSIVAGLLLGAGADVRCNPDYRKYFDMYKNI